MKYGFIGCGNMASAMIKGGLRNNSFVPGDVYICNATKESQEARVRELGVHGCEDIEQLIEEADWIFLGVKPSVLPAILTDAAAQLHKRNRLVISMAAGQSLENIAGFVKNRPLPVVRIMPNVNAEVGVCVTALCRNQNVPDETFRQVLELFEGMGTATELQEHLFGIFTAIAGCSPAFTFLFIDALATGAQKLGMNKKQATEMAAWAVLGSAKLLIENGTHPCELIDRVCSPGGTTIDGLVQLTDYRFENAVIHAVEAAVNKDRQLGMQGK